MGDGTGEEQSRVQVQVEDAFGWVLHDTRSCCIVVYVSWCLQKESCFWRENAAFSWLCLSTTTVCDGEPLLVLWATSFRSSFTDVSPHKRTTSFKLRVLFGTVEVIFSSFSRPACFHVQWIPFTLTPWSGLQAIATTASAAAPPAPAAAYVNRGHDAAS